MGCTPSVATFAGTRRCARHSSTSPAPFRLSGAERDALLAGDVATLERMGAHGYLLANLGRARVFGLDRQSYVRRIKGGPLAR